MKNTLILLTALFVFSGCCEKASVATYPEIKVLERVPTIDVNVSNGCVCGDDLSKLVNTSVMLRKSETYYREQVNKYNSDFVKANNGN